MNVVKIRPMVLASLSNEARERILKLADWRLAGVARRAQRRCGWSDTERRAVERAYRRFLTLIAIDPESTYGMIAGSIDEFWHEHILDTMDYERMCHEVFGQTIHHCPMDVGGADQAAKPMYSTTTLPALRRVFGVRAGRLWPAHEDASAVAKCCGHIGNRLAA